MEPVSHDSFAERQMSFGATRKFLFSRNTKIPGEIRDFCFGNSRSLAFGVL